jgi:hypothetical protein
MSAANVERDLNALRRLPDNRICGTCRIEERFGFKNVCMKFRIFVCSDCKSAHQALSHKCKSVTMSNWSRAEVDELKAPNGGNSANFSSIFARLEAVPWPVSKGCHPNDLKEFVRTAYDELKWHDPAGKLPPAIRGSISAPDVTSEDPPRISQSLTAPQPAIANLLGDEDLIGGSLNNDLLSALTIDSSAGVPAARVGYDWTAFQCAPPEAPDETFGAFESAPSTELAFGAFESAAISSLQATGPTVQAASAARPFGAAGLNIGMDAFTDFAQAPIAAFVPTAHQKGNDVNAVPTAVQSAIGTPVSSPPLGSMGATRVPLGADFINMEAVPAFSSPMRPITATPMGSQAPLRMPMPMPTFGMVKAA